MDKLWTERFLNLADTISSWSKDPSTKVGAVIVRPDKTIASLGYNGFPRGVEDTSERLNDRPTKYAMVVHAESNAILNARERLDGYHLFSRWCPCNECAKDIIQSGIKTVTYRETIARWEEQSRIAKEMFNEAGVELIVQDN